MSENFTAHNNSKIDFIADIWALVMGLPFEPNIIGTCQW